MVNSTLKEVTNPVAGQDGDHAGGTDWNQMSQTVKGSHATERIQSTSIQQINWITKSAVSQTLGTTEEFILADATSNNVAITLPTTASALQTHFCIKRIDSSTSTLVTISTTSAQTIDGLSSYILYNRGQTVDLISDGSNWRIKVPDAVGFHQYRGKGGTLNRFYSSELVVNTASTTSTVVAGTMYAFPVIFAKTTTISTVQVNVTTLGSGSSVYAALYADNGNLYPSALVADFGSVSSATTGIKSFSSNLPVTVQAGLYWLAFNCSATAPVVSGWVVAQMFPILGTTSALTAALGVGWSVSQAAGAFPNPFTGSGTVIIAVPCPAIFFQTSG